MATEVEVEVQDCEIDNDVSVDIESRKTAATAREPSTTNNCWPSRAQKSRGKAGTRRPSGRSAKNPLPHRHRHKVRNPELLDDLQLWDLDCLHHCGACTTFTTGTSTTIRSTATVESLWSESTQFSALSGP